MASASPTWRDDIWAPQYQSESKFRPVELLLMELSFCVMDLSYCTQIVAAENCWKDICVTNRLENLQNRIEVFHVINSLASRHYARYYLHRWTAKTEETHAME